MENLPSTTDALFQHMMQDVLHIKPAFGQLVLYPNHLHFKGTATGSISHVPQGKLVVLRGTPSKPVVTVVQQLVLKNGYHMVAVPSRSKKKEGVKL